MRKEENEFLIVCVPAFSTTVTSQSALSSSIVFTGEPVLAIVLAVTPCAASICCALLGIDSVSLIMRIRFRAWAPRESATRQRLGLDLWPVVSLEHGSGMILVARDLTGENTWRVLLTLDGSRSSMEALRTMIRYFKCVVAGRNLHARSRNSVGAFRRRAGIV